MILLIDNYDSFTWNLYQYFCELGADVLVRRNDELTLAQIDALSPQKIVISPGPCTPDDAVFRWRLFAISQEDPSAGRLSGAPGDGAGLWRDRGSGGESDAW